MLYTILRIDDRLISLKHFERHAIYLYYLCDLKVDLHFGHPCFGSWAISFLLHTSFFHLVEINLSFIDQKILAPKLRRLFSDFFLAKSVLAFLLFSITSGFYLVVYPLYIDPWRSLLFVDFDNDPSTSWSIISYGRWYVVKTMAGWWWQFSECVKEGYRVLLIFSCSYLRWNVNSGCFQIENEPVVG